MAASGELVPTTRVAKLLWHLSNGEELTNAEAGAIAGVTPSGAARMLCRISLIWPIYNYRRDGRDVWTVLRAEYPE